MNAFVLSPLAVAAAVASVIAAVILLYLLHPPARRLFVSSNLIWERVLETTRRVSDRWRWWLSLLIAGVICLCVVLSVVRPGLDGSDASGKAIVVIDNSPTMAALTSSGVTRFVVAKARATELIETFSSATQVMVVDTQRQLVTPAFESPAQAIEVLAGVQLGHEYLPIVPSVIASIPAQRRFVVTDGVLLGAPPPEFTTVSVFEPTGNLGITAFDFQNVPGSPARREAFIEVHNASGERRDTEIVISGGGGQRIARNISIDANSTLAQTFDLSTFNGGPVRAALSATGDGFADDDVAFGYLSSRRVVRVTLVSESDKFLAKSLASQPRVRLNVVPPQRYKNSPDTDVYIFDRFVPAVPPAAPALLFSPRQANWLPARGGSVSLPAVTVANSGHPVMANISLRDLHVEKANVLRTPEDGLTSVILRADTTKVLAVAHNSAIRWLWFGFDAESSNLGLLASFPVLLGNSINWLADEPEILRASPGTVTVPFDDARVYAMNGSELPVVAVNGKLHFDAVTPGLYTVIGKDRPMRVTVNLLDQRISAVNRSAIAPAKPMSLAAQGANDELPFGLSALLLVIAAGLLCVEWFAYHRRVTV